MIDDGTAKADQSTNHVDEIAGQIVVVTGAAERAGRHIAIAFADRGARVVVNHFQQGTLARDVVKEIRLAGGEAIEIEEDIADPVRSRSLVDRVVDAYGRVDVLIHNASTFKPIPFEDISVEDFDASLGVNLRGPFFLSQACARVMMTQKKGRIVAIVGNSYYEAWPTFIHHSLGKSGLARLMELLAIALSPYVQCNAICPAQYYRAPDAPPPVRDETLYRTAGEIDVRLQKGSPEAVIELLLYLATCSGYMTGAVIPIDGGKHLS